MVAHIRPRWSKHVDQVIRSHHYNWLGEGLSGVPVEQALVDITTDILHICKREGVDWETVLRQSQAQFQREERHAAMTEASLGS